MNKPLDLPLLRDDAAFAGHLENEAARLDAAAEAQRREAGARVGIS